LGPVLRREGQVVGGRAAERVCESDSTVAVSSTSDSEPVSETTKVVRSRIPLPLSRYETAMVPVSGSTVADSSCAASVISSEKTASTAAS
jgi:hypothetical protein